MKKLLLTMATILVLVTLAGLENNAQADPVYACFQKNHGQLRIVSNPNECLKSEEPIILSGEFSSGESIPDLMGIWHANCEGWGVTGGSSDNGYFTITATMKISDQTGGAFAGSIQPSNGEEQTITGVIIGNQVTINVSDASIIRGSFNPLSGNLQLGIADHNHDLQQWSTVRCIAKR